MSAPPAAPTDDDDALAASPRRRLVLFALGWVFFGLGVIGAVLPIVPTTPFMLLALWAFSSSSPRFHAWLYHHRIFGPPLQRWRRDRTVPLWTKLVALGSMAASLAWVGLHVRPPAIALAAMVAVVIAGATYILRLPTRPPARERQARS